MDMTSFHQRAGETLAHIERAVEDSGVDIDFENAGDILTLEFADGSKIIINQQEPAGQIWVAARAGGFHYGYDPRADRWVNDRSGGELFTELSHLVSEQAGMPVDLT